MPKDWNVHRFGFLEYYLEFLIIKYGLVIPKLRSGQVAFMGDDPFRPRSSGGKRVIMGTKALKAKMTGKKNRS